MNAQARDQLRADLIDFYLEELEGAQQLEPKELATRLKAFLARLARSHGYSAEAILDFLGRDIRAVYCGLALRPELN
jgi:hypothetical protein